MVCGWSYLAFASAGSAIAWRSFIGGAVESGYRGAREIDGFLIGREFPEEAHQQANPDSFAFVANGGPHEQRPI
jgi:hypothetical protein